MIFPCRADGADAGAESVARDERHALLELDAALSNEVSGCSAGAFYSRKQKLSKRAVTGAGLRNDDRSDGYIATFDGAMMKRCIAQRITDELFPFFASMLFARR